MSITTEKTILSDEAANRSILEAEVKQLRDFLTEALADSSRLYREKEELQARLDATRQSEATARQKLIYIAETSGEETSAPSSVEVLLRAELAQASDVLERTRRSLHELSMFSAAILGHSTDPNSLASGPTIRLIEATLESIETTLISTSG